MSIKLLNRVTGALAAALIASPVIAADETTNEDEPVMEEIIVTATYRDTRLMDTPLAISAVTSEDMVLKGIEDIQTLFQAIPGLSYRAGGATSGGGAQLSIRGITPSLAIGYSGAVGVYLDNQPITDSAVQGGMQTQGSLFDMDRVEVLKGPQGTLYGEGNMGGSVRYISNKPDTSGLDYHVRSSFESSSKSDDLSYRIDAMVNIPLADQLALRLVGYRRDRAGVLDQVAPANRKDVDTFEENGIRAALKWDASETFEVTAMVNVVDSETGGPRLAFHCNTEPSARLPGGNVPLYDLPGTTCASGPTDLFDHGDPYVTHIAHPDIVDAGYDDQTNYNFSIDWELPFADLISSTSYFEREANTAMELGGGAVSLIARFVNQFRCLGQLTVCGPNTMSALAFDNTAYRFTERVVQEFRLISNTDGPLQWTLGAYYKDDESQLGRIAPCTSGSPVTAALDKCRWLPGFFPDVPLENQILITQWFNGFLGEGSNNYLDYKEQAIYGEASYRLSDQWEIQFGLRLAEVEHALAVGRTGINSKVDPVFSHAKPTDIVAPKVVLTWRPIEDWMIFATYSEGFRPGLINRGIVNKIVQLGGFVDDPDLPAEIRTVAQAEIDSISSFQTTESDFVENTELGIKATVLDGRLSFTGALYRIAFEDYVLRIQYNLPEVLPGGRVALYGANAGSAESEGLELEVRLALTDRLFLSFGGDKSFKAHLTSVHEVIGEILNITPGTRMSNAPDDSYYASLAYNFDLFGMDAMARVDTYGVASSLRVVRAQQLNRHEKPAYQTTDVKLLVNLDNWMLSAYVRNVTNDKIVNGFGAAGYQLGQPRTFGVQVHYRR